MKAYNDFLKIVNTPYNYDEDNKRLWGLRGKKFIKELAKEVGAEAVKVVFNPSGIIDRGYVSGFIRKNGKFIYISISDSAIFKSWRMGEILYRTAKDENDYTGGSNNYFRLGDDINKLCKAINEMLN
jgi:hypothetical protein